MSSHVPLDRIKSISLWTASFQSSASGDAYVSAIVVGVSSTRYTVKSSPKDFATLCLLLLRGASLSSFSRISSRSTGCSEVSVTLGATGSDLRRKSRHAMHIFHRKHILKKYCITRFHNTINMHIRYLRFITTKNL